MSYLKILGLTELGLVGIHALQIISSNLDFYTESFFWWIAIHTLMLYFIFTEFYAGVEKDAETTIRSEPLKKTSNLKSNASKKSNIEDPWYKPFLNMCSIDHALLYDDEIEGDNSSNEENNIRQKSS